jgi:hypothetical protein
MGIAAELCIFTNDRFTISTVPDPTGSPFAGEVGADSGSEVTADHEG